MINKYSKYIKSGEVISDLTSVTGGIVSGISVDYPANMILSCRPDVKADGGAIIHVAENAVPVIFNGKCVGASWEDGDIRWTEVSGILPDDTCKSSKEQAESVLENLDNALIAGGSSFDNVVRTWFINNNINDWYNDFNAARNSFFKKRGVYDRIVPASTGVGAPNHAGTALIASAISVQPLNNSVKISAIPSPLQCPAPAYGSSFSRALEIENSKGRRLFISGTASIEPGGATVFADDVKKQIELTGLVISAILESRGMAFANVSSGICWCAVPDAVPAFYDWAQDNDFPAERCMTASADICRPDLLIELELEAYQAKD
jgi:enamine deaminase RidA (YjgF/YER057c/UK114 family)